MVNPSAHAGMRAAWSALPGNARGGIWMLAAALSMGVQSAAVKSAGETLGTYQIVFCRCVVGLVLVAPLMRREITAILRPARLRLHLGRVMAGLISMTCGFYAFAHMPLAEATALSFTMPLFMLVLAMLALGERVGWRRTSATLAGFAGVLVMLRPGAVPIQLAALLALAGAFFHACSGVFIKKLATSETTAMIMFYFAAVGSVLFLAPAVHEWVAPDALGWVLLATVAILGVTSQLAFIKAARVAEMSAIVPIDYSRLIFAGIIGFVVWSEVPDGWAVAGASLIATSTCFITYRRSSSPGALRVKRAELPGEMLRTAMRHVDDNPTVLELLAGARDRSPERLYLRFGEERLTLSALDRRVRALAGTLAAAGLRRGTGCRW